MMTNLAKTGFENAEEASVSFSVVINTDNRLDYLKRTLGGLRYSRYRNFEVCVVAGPTPDGTREYLETLKGEIKVAHCPERILSMSRNIGIAMAAGDVVCFIDDDAVPEPEWLGDLAEAYRDPDVGAAGGFVYDNSGVNFQARYVTTNRLGYPTDWNVPAPHINFPFALDYPHLLGTNCSFRRSALLEIGGFDEEFEYFLDETDVCCRINDAGYRIAQLSNAFVHHKYAPSHLRDERKIVRNWYPLLKNRIYFGLRNGLNHHSKHEVVEAGLADARGWEHGIECGRQSGDYSAEEVVRFYDEAERAVRDGQARASEPAKMLSEATRVAYRSDFSRYPVILPDEDRSTICFVTQDYPPGQNGGIARNVAQLARSFAAEGHQVHVLTKSRGTGTLDFEDGVWVHRVEMRHFPEPSPSPIAPHAVPSHIWNYGQTMLAEVRAIDAKHKVDIVYCPLWDCEPLAFLLSGEFPLIVALQTTMRFWLESQPLKVADAEWMREFGRPILAMEELILQNAGMMHANSRAIVRDIREQYGLALPEDRLFYSPHGMEDWSQGMEPAPPATGGETRMLFVGRLESRKGIDVLLEAIPQVLQAYPNAILDIVGDDTIPRPDGTTYKGEFLKRKLPMAVASRIRFHGRVEEDELRRFYQKCDIFVAPSRYESFGLVFLEAMVFGKPVIAGDAGGGPEVVTDGESGLLVPPGDSVALGAALERLLADPLLRSRLGANARRHYETRFTDAVMVRDFLAAFVRMGVREERGTAIEAPSGSDQMKRMQLASAGA
ncbi:glycosyltransferase [Sphingomonas sp. HF-S3]|uniref:Glycosyltransferase n=1 Tax=Sphingomonas rustica TaxID=3103142 RepID=A0ABV0BCM5_9SPHN